MTGGRIRKAREYVGDERFMLTYGDGLSDINMSDQLDFHRSHGKLVTMTAVQPDGKFGAFDHTNDGKVSRFVEKPRGDGSWINGGFLYANLVFLIISKILKRLFLRNLHFRT